MLVLMLVLLLLLLLLYLTVLLTLRFSSRTYARAAQQTHASYAAHAYRLHAPARWPRCVYESCVLSFPTERICPLPRGLASVPLSKYTTHARNAHNTVVVIKEQLIANINVVLRVHPNAMITVHHNNLRQRE